MIIKAYDCLQLTVLIILKQMHLSFLLLITEYAFKLQHKQHNIKIYNRQQHTQLQTNGKIRFFIISSKY